MIFFDELNHSFVVLLLLLCGSIVTVSQFTASTIKCLGFTKFPSGFAEDYCWTQGLYTINGTYTVKHAQIYYPGIYPIDLLPCWGDIPLKNGKYHRCPPADKIKPLEKVHHLWYQWVPFYFVLTAAAFYLPHLLFKVGGFGRIKPVLDPLSNLVPLGDGEEHRKTAASTARWIYLNYFPPRRGFSCGTLWSQYQLVVVRLGAKLLYLTISVSIFILTAEMFPLGDFLTYGMDFIEAMSHETMIEQTLVRDKLFPKMVGCEIRRLGSTGTEKEHGLCVLAPNVVNQYLFLIVWFAYVAVISTNTISFVTALLDIALGSFTGYLSFIRMSVTSQRRKGRAAIRRMFVNRAGVSGRLILRTMSRNVHSRLMEQILVCLVKECGEGEEVQLDSETSSVKIPPRYNSTKKRGLYPDAPPASDDD